MHGYINSHPVELTPGFRRDDRGRKVATVAYSIPLRNDDLVTLLYRSALTVDDLADADLVRETVVCDLLERGGRRLNRDKALLRAQVNAGTHDPDRLHACQQRIATLFTSRRGKAGTRRRVHSSEEAA